MKEGARAGRVGLHWETIFQAVGHPTLILGPEHTIVMANDATAKATGIPRDKLAGKKCYEVFHASTSPPEGCPLESIHQSGQMETEAMEMEALGGTYLVTCTPVFDDRGKLRSVIHIATDITERKEAEEKHTHILHAAMDGFFLIDTRGCFVEVNDATCGMTGYSREELLDMHVSDIEARMDPDEILEAMKRIRKAGGARFESRMKQKDGGVIDVELSITFMDIQDGRFVVFMKNITDRKKAEQELLEREDRLSKIMIAANDGMWDWDLQTDEVYFDPRYYEMAGYDVDEFPHRLDAFQKRVHPDDVEYVMDQARQHLNGAIDRFIVEFRFKKKTGDWLWVEGRGKIVEHDENGMPLRFVGTHTDITARKMAEQRYRSVVENAHDAIYIIHPVHGFQYVNPEFEKLTGYRADEIYSDTFSFWDIIHPDDVAMIEERGVARARGEEVAERYNFRIVAKDGTTHIVEANTVVIGTGGEALVMGILRDITQRRQAEKEREQAYQEMERALQLEKRFKADAAHFFLNPIAICKGYMDLAMQNMPDECREHITASRAAVNRVEAVIKNIVEKGEIHE